MTAMSYFIFLKKAGLWNFCNNHRIL